MKKTKSYKIYFYIFLILYILTNHLYSLGVSSNKEELVEAFKTSLDYMPTYSENEVVDDDYIILTKDSKKTIFSKNFGLCFGIIAIGNKGVLLGHFAPYIPKIKEGKEFFEKTLLEKIESIGVREINFYINPDSIELDIEEDDCVTWEIEDNLKNRKKTLQSLDALIKYYSKEIPDKPIKKFFFNTEANRDCYLAVASDGIIEVEVLTKEEDIKKKIDKINNDQIESSA